MTMELPQLPSRLDGGFNNIPQSASRPIAPYDEGAITSTDTFLSLSASRNHCHTAPAEQKTGKEGKMRQRSNVVVLAVLSKFHKNVPGGDASSTQLGSNHQQFFGGATWPKPKGVSSCINANRAFSAF